MGLEDKPKASLGSWIGGRADAMAAEATLVEEMYVTVLRLEDTFEATFLGGGLSGVVLTKGTVEDFRPICASGSFFF